MAEQMKNRQWASLGNPKTKKPLKEFHFIGILLPNIYAPIAQLDRAMAF